MGRTGPWFPGDVPGLHNSDISSSLCWANLGLSLSTLTRLTLNLVSILAPWLWDWFYDAHSSGNCLKSFTSWQSQFFWTWTGDSLIRSPELPSTSLLRVNPLGNPATRREPAGNPVCLSGVPWTEKITFISESKASFSPCLEACTETRFLGQN